MTISLLGLLWWSSLLLAGVALGSMAGLIIARLFREHREAQRRADQLALSSAILAIMGDVQGAAARLDPFKFRSRLLAETLRDVLGLVRGAERDRLITALINAGIDDRLRHRLTRGSRTGRLAAVEALLAFPSAQTSADLRSLHKLSNDAEIRIASVRTLIAIGYPPKIQELIRDFDGRPDKDSLLYAPVLRQLAIDAPDDALATLAMTALAGTTRAVTIDAVGVSGDYRALPMLSQLVADKDPVVRMAAVRALGALGHPSAAGTVAAALHDDAWDVRVEAAVAAGRLGVSTLVPGLSGLLDDPVWWVRFRAADALSRMGGAGIEALRLAASSPFAVTRRSASLALAEMGLE